jgi:hypothetical protein
MGRIIILLFGLILLNSLKAAGQLRLRASADTAEGKLTLKVLPQKFYKQPEAFFCKKEVQLQRATRLPLFIRLGSKDYVDYLERKPNAGAISKGYLIATKTQRQ